MRPEESIRDSKKLQKIKMPLLGELSRSSRDSFESDSDSKESWDDGLNPFKNGVSKFLRFFVVLSWAEVIRVVPSVKSRKKKHPNGTE